MSSSVGVNTHALVRRTCLSAQHSRNGSKRRVRTRATEVVEEDAKISASVQDVKRELLAAAAASGRGEAASSIQKDEIRNLSSKLIPMNPTESPVTSACINGTWELLYSSSFAFRSSPFFWAVGKLLGPQADFFYDAHDHQTGMFGGGCGRCVQKIDLTTGTLTSDCIVKASVGIPLLGFAPLISGFGSVITKGEARAVAPDTIAVPLGSLSTTVSQDDASVLPALNFLNGTTVPVGDVMSRISDASSEVSMRTMYLDDELRISELEDATLLIYRRVD